MIRTAGPRVRDAVPEDVGAICAFGAEHVGAHYAPLIGAEAAARQVRDWWNPEHVGAAVGRGLVVVAVTGRSLVGVAQRGRSGGEHVVYKLYLHPAHRGGGLGPRLLEALEASLPDDASRLWVEHFAANERAGAFYEREGFVVDRVEPGPSGDPRLAVVWRVRPRSPRTDPP